jgi:hypothetical protein
MPKNEELWDEDQSFQSMITQCEAKKSELEQTEEMNLPAEVKNPDVVSMLSNYIDECAIHPMYARPLFALGI